MSAIPYMPFYIADYMADAAHLTTEEHGAYLLLIMTYWQRGKPLSANPARLAVITRLSSERWTDVEPTLREFFEVVDGEWRHKRIDAELSKYRDKVEKAKAAGKASAARRCSPKTSENDEGGEQSFNGRSTVVEPTLNHTESESEAESDNKSTSFTSRVSAREGSFKFGQAGKASRGVSPRLKGIAEGLGLNVDVLASRAEAPGVKQANAYFRSLAQDELRRKLPQAPDALLKTALTFEGDAARQSVYQMLVGAA